MNTPSKNLLPWLVITLSLVFAPPSMAQTDEARLHADLRSLEQLRQQLNLIEPLRQRHAEQFNMAEAFHRKTLQSFRKGDLASARRNASLASEVYRIAVLDALQAEPLKKAQDAVRHGYQKVDERRATRAQQHIDEARAIIREARGRDFQIVAVTDAVFNALSTALDLIGPEVAADPFVCTEAVEPGVAEFEVVAPPPARLLNHNPIYYLEGNTLEVSLLLSRCTHVREVSLVLFDGPGGTIQLDTEATTYDPIEGTSGHPYYYDIVSDIPEADRSRHRVTLNLHFPDHDDGRSIGVHLLVGSGTGQPVFSEQRKFTVSLVKEVGGQGRWGLAENEMRNDFIANIYQEYGDDGRSHEGGLYNPSYRDLVVQIEEDGIHFKWRVKKDLEHFCHPTIKIDGRFEIVIDGGMLAVEWADDGPEVGIDFALICDVAEPLLGIGFRIAKEFARANARQEVKDRIAAQVATLAAALDARAIRFIDSIDLTPGELQVVFNLPLDRVTVDLPYGQLRLQEPVNFGLALNPGDRVFTLASGLASVCGIDGRALPSCDTATNPTGNFNWNTNNPIPSPWFVTDAGAVGYLKHRHNAWKELVGLRRSAARLPFPNENVGVLLGRLENAAGKSRHRLLTDGCAVTARDGSEDRLAFGPNDHRFNDLRDNGTGTWQVTVHWALPILELPTCTEAALPLMTTLDEPQPVFQ